MIIDLLDSWHLMKVSHSRQVGSKKGKKRRKGSEEEFTTVHFWSQLLKNSN
jgi:hypothetical protein